MSTFDAPLSTPAPLRPFRLLLWFVILAAVCPSIVWAFADRRAWPYDEAWYGQISVDLFYTLVYAPSEWLPAMMSAFGWAAPGIAWGGQFFVPVGRLVGSIDAGLLLSIVAVQAIALYLVARALWDLSGGSRKIACAGVLVMASAPLFIGLSHHYLVEMQQAAAVAWFVLIMVRAPRWSPLFIIGQLLLATTVAMLAKVSSPLFCFGPGLAAMYSAVRDRNRAASEPISRSIRAFAIGVPLAVAALAWYQQNIQSVVDHVSFASTGRVAELYGKSDAFLQTLMFWMTAFGKNFFTTVTVVVAAITMAAAVVTLFAARRARDRSFDRAAIVSGVQVVVTLAVFSLASNRDDRYLLPLVSYVALLMSWALARLNRRAISFLVMASFALQWGQLHAQAMGLVPMRQVTDWLTPMMRNPNQRALLDDIVDRTCADMRSSIPARNDIGVNLLWLNGPGVSYAASKKLAPMHRVPCNYEGIDYFDADEGAAWNRLISRNITYFVGLDASAYQIPSDPLYRTLNALNQPILQRVETSGQFAPEPGLARLPGLRIFKRIDYVGEGRSLLDRGMHALAIEQLKRATIVQPENVEAWANLAYAYESAGDLPNAATAGNQARHLSPTHYYVNLGLARVANEQQQWTEAIVRAQDAAAHAPGETERGTALALAAQASFESGDVTNGCALLVQAAAVQSVPGLVDELRARGCGSGKD